MSFDHGHSDGVEVPKISSVSLFMGGFIGVAIGFFSEKLKNAETIVSHLGSAIMGIGVYILYELIR